MKVARIFQSGMVLQREKPIKIWGMAEPGEKITIGIQGKHAEATVSKDGSWEAICPALHTSENETLFIYSDKERMELNEIAIGEVWVAGGQSNMEFPLLYEKHFAQEKAICKNLRLRFYDVPEVCFDGQEALFDYSHVAVWRKASSAEEAGYFSAVGYYFQKVLEKELDTPVGIVGCNWGGTTSSVWMSRESVEKTGKPWIEEYKKQTADLDMDAFWEAQKTNPQNDRGNPNMDPFSAMLLPRTPSIEEINAFLEGSSAGGINLTDMDKQLQPQQIPACLYEHMIKAIAPFGIRGFLWYQGESDDAGDQSLYKDMLLEMISDWRTLWGDKSLPFLLVQLPGWENWVVVKNENYAEIRRCQEAAAKEDAHAYLCSISDAGEQFDIHPKDKKVVGKRLALLALGHVYGQELLCDAPVLKAARRENTEIVLIFENAGSGLYIKGDILQALEVYAGDTRITYQAAAEGNQVKIHLSEAVTGAVRLAFARTKFYLVNLYNEAGIPAIPFEIELSSESEGEVCM